MQTKQEKQVEIWFNAYARSVDKYAEKVFNQRIKPWLKKYHLRFVSGNGTYFIGYTDKTPAWFVDKYHGYYTGAIDQDKIDRRIAAILDSEIEGMPANSLGTIMPQWDGG